MLNDYNDVMTVEEVASVLYTGKNTIYNLLRSGELKAFRIGSKWKIPKLSLQEYIATQAGLNI